MEEAHIIILDPLELAESLFTEDFIDLGAWEHTLDEAALADVDLGSSEFEEIYRQRKDALIEASKYSASIFHTALQTLRLLLSMDNVVLDVEDSLIDRMVALREAAETIAIGSLVTLANATILENLPTNESVAKLDAADRSVPFIFE